MKKEHLIFASFMIFIVLTTAGALMKIMHWENASFVLGGGIAALAIFILVALYEIFKSDRVPINEKIMWLVGLFFLGWLGAFLYVLIGRKRIIKN
jgi:hypothetical protein